MPAFKYRILLVDDEENIRVSAAAVLGAAGYEVLTAQDGLEALQCLDAALPELIISDLRMPRMSGFEFLAVISRRFPQIPTIALSGEYVTDDAPDGLLADAFLRKGQYDVEDLLRLVRQLLTSPPARAFPGTKSTSTIWVPVHGSGEAVVTCPQCLRSFGVHVEGLKIGCNQASCSFCQFAFSYHVDSHNMETLLRGDKARTGRGARVAS